MTTKSQKRRQRRVMPFMVVRVRMRIEEVVLVEPSLDLITVLELYAPCGIPIIYFAWMEQRYT